MELIQHPHCFISVYSAHNLHEDCFRLNSPLPSKTVLETWIKLKNDAITQNLGTKLANMKFFLTCYSRAAGSYRLFVVTEHSDYMVENLCNALRNASYLYILDGT